MPGNTAINGLRYTLLTDAPANIQTATKNLAEDVDTKLVSVFTTTTARDAAITVPSEGMLCYISGVINAYYTYTGSAWEKMGRTRTKVKTVQEAVNNTVTFQNDDELFISVGANKTYSFHLALIVSGDPAADVSVRFTFPSGSLVGGGMGQERGMTTSVSDMTSRGIITGSSPSDNWAFGIYGLSRTFNIVEGVLTTAGTPGNFQVQWANATAAGVGVSLTNVCEGSYILITEL